MSCRLTIKSDGKNKYVARVNAKDVASITVHPGAEYIVNLFGRVEGAFAPSMNQAKVFVRAMICNERAIVDYVKLENEEYNCFFQGKQIAWLMSAEAGKWWVYLDQTDECCDICDVTLEIAKEYVERRAAKTKAWKIKRLA